MSDEPKLVNAQSFLLIPLNFLNEENFSNINEIDNNNLFDPTLYEDALLQRNLSTNGLNELISLWKVCYFPQQRDSAKQDYMPRLSEEFNRNLGWKKLPASNSGNQSKNISENNNENNNENLVNNYEKKNDIWQARRLRLSKKARKIIFSNTFILTEIFGNDFKNKENCKNEIIQVEINSVELLLEPLGTGLLILHLDWVIKNNSIESLPVLKKWILRITDQLIENKKIKVSWILNDSINLQNKFDIELGNVNKSKKNDKTFNKKNKNNFDFNHEELYSLGQISDALLDGEPINLNTILNWLIHLPNENPSLCKNRIRNFPYHHSIATLNSVPSHATLDQFIFRFYDLSFTQNNFWQNSNLMKSYSKNIRRSKLVALDPITYMGLSPEGCFCINWMQNDDNYENSINGLSWKTCLFLIEQNYIEKAVLSQLGHLSMKQIEAFNDKENNSSEKMVEYCNKFRKIATLMVRFMLGMNTDDINYHQYIYIFKEMQNVLSIPLIKAEIREQIDDLLAIVEVINKEEQKKSRILEKDENKIIEKNKTKKATEIHTRRKRMELMLMAVSAITLPMFLITNYFTMNISGIPPLDFWTVFGLTMASAIGIILFMLILWYCCFKITKTNYNKMTFNVSKLKKKIGDAKKNNSFDDSSEDSYKRNNKGTSMDILRNDY